MSNVARANYADRNGRSISFERYVELLGDLSYVNVRLFRNHAIELNIVWLGLVKGEHEFISQRELFRMSMRNKSGDKWVNDPNFDGRTFPTEKSALDIYEGILNSWTDSHYGEDGKLIEVGNDLTPPPPPSPDAPSAAMQTLKGIADDGVGAW